MLMNQPVKAGWGAGTDGLGLTAAGWGAGSSALVLMAVSQLMA
jgi:hypothetical protein